MENINFNFSHICKYNDEILSDNEGDNESELFKTDFLNLFHLEEYDNVVISDTVDKLWNYITETSNDVIFKKLVLKFCSDIDGFIFLFAFEFLDKFVNCLKDLHSNGVVSPNNIVILENILDCSSD